MTPEALLDAGVITAATGIRFWQDGIHDHQVADDSPCARRCKALIDGFIREKHGLGWDWKPPYKGDGDPRHRGGWCGAFAAAAWAPAGLVFKAREKHLASTLRLHEWARGERLIRDHRLIRAGDIVTVGRKRHPKEGDHIIVVVESPSEGEYPDVEGNGEGEGPDGKKYEGVVRRVRRVKDIVLAIRPLPEDLGPIVQPDGE